MNTTIDAAKDLLANPTDELKAAMAGANDEARSAIASITPEDSTLHAVLKNKNGGPSHSNGNDGSARLQVVDEDQQFTQQLPDYMQKWGLYDAGFDYNIVAVFGSQSTGKSTLLNKVFGTTFDVMDESERRQTTKGIWMCRGKDSQLVVMDVEGTDGRERGEDQDFERKSALFSMASAEILVVNMWEHQVGLFQGANMGLLKTVLEVNLGLFQASKARHPSAHKDKTLLLFVIRDHVGATPLQNLANTLKQDLNRIWDGLAKPEGLEKSQIGDYFDMDFTTLPHKLLQPERFEEEILQLRARFVDRQNTFFKPIYHKRIPADGFAPYLSNIWQQVLENKDLDLPTQQELLAQFRCDEIASAAFLAFEAQTAAYKRPIDAGQVLDGLGPGMSDARQVALVAFDTAASRYHAGVYSRKRAELLSKMNASLASLFVGQLTNLQKATVRDFRAHMQATLKSGESYDFGTVVAEATQAAEQRFTVQAKSIALSETDWSYDEALAQLRADLAGISDTLRAEETRKMVVGIERTVRKQYAPGVELALNKPAADMWDKVLLAFKEALDKAEGTYARKAKGFNCTDEENAAALALLRRRSWLALRSVVDEQTADTVMVIKLKLAFEDKFRYDKDGVPRIWKPEDDIDTAFRAAKDETLALIPLYARIAPRDPSAAFTLDDDENTSPVENAASGVGAEADADFDFAETLVVLSERRQAELADRFRRESDAYYVEAKRSMVSSIAAIPVWVYAVIGLLGWNEFIAVVRNPLYFTLVLVLIAGAYVTVQLNMSGPVIALAKGVSREVVRVVNDTLRDHFSQPQAVSGSTQRERKLEQPHLASSMGTSRRSGEPESIELKKME